MQRSLIIGLVVFLAVAVGLGWYVHAFNASGADAAGYMTGYMVALLAFAGIGVWLATRKKTNWTSQNRVATSMLIAAALAVITQGEKISEAYYARQMVGAITAAKTTDDALKALTSMDNELGRAGGQVTELSIAVHTEAAEMINKIELAADEIGDVYFETIKDRERLRRANIELTRLVGQARDGQGQIKAAFENLRRDAKALLAQSGLGSRMQASFFAGFEESTSDWGGWYVRRMAYTERLVQAMLDLHLFVAAQNGRYRVDDNTVRFQEAAMADRYNQMSDALRPFAAEGERLEAERDAILKKWQGRLESFQAQVGKR